jgi:hypothetical protein
MTLYRSAKKRNSTSKRKIGVQGKDLRSQTKEVIANVLQFFKDEAEHGPRIPLTNFKVRLMAATGISERSYRMISKESKESEPTSTSFSSPSKRKCPESSPDSKCAGALQCIRDIIYNFYIIEKRRPSLQGELEMQISIPISIVYLIPPCQFNNVIYFFIAIYQKVCDSGLEFNGCKSTLWRLIKKIGFGWKKTSDNRRALEESYDIRLKRTQYVRNITKFREEGRCIVYTDETYIHSSHTRSNDWIDDKNLALKKPINKGQRLIILHAGGEAGFINNGLLMFKSGM